MKKYPYVCVGLFIGAVAVGFVVNRVGGDSPNPVEAVPPTPINSPDASSLDWIPVAGPNGGSLGNSKKQIYLVRSAALWEAIDHVGRQRGNISQETLITDPVTGDRELFVTQQPVAAFEALQFVDKLSVRAVPLSDPALLRYCDLLPAHAKPARVNGRCELPIDAVTLPNLATSE